MSLNIFLDDDPTRKPEKWTPWPTFEWVIVRSYDEFVNYITTHGIPKYCSFDHDLHPEHYVEFRRAYDNDGIFRYDKVTEKTGYCACKNKHSIGY